MILVRTIQDDRIPIKGATEKDFKLILGSKMARIKDYCFNWDQIAYFQIIDEEEA